MKLRIMYACSTCWLHDPDFRVYASVERLKDNCYCWEECGIVEVEVKRVKDITPCKL